MSYWNNRSGKFRNSGKFKFNLIKKIRYFDLPSCEYFVKYTNQVITIDFYCSVQVSGMKFEKSSFNLMCLKKLAIDEIYIIETFQK
jgi:hypothetical protein